LSTFLLLSFHLYPAPTHIHTFPTRRSSDLGHVDIKGHDAIKRVYSAEHVGPTLTTMTGGHRQPKIALEDSEIWTPIKDFEGIYRSEEHTSELQSRFDLVCRLLLEKKN